MAQASADDAEDDDVLAEWGVEPVVEFELAEQPTSHPHVIAQPVDITPSGGIRLAAGTSPPAEMQRSRTATVHDPLTTSVLAEVARRTQTLDLPAQDDDKLDPKSPNRR